MNIVIMGGGKVGESLARRILEGRRHEVRIIESERAGRGDHLRRRHEH